LRRVKVAHALDANIWIDHIKAIPLGNSLDGAFWLAGPTTDAIVADNLHRHLVHLFVFFSARPGGVLIIQQFAASSTREATIARVVAKLERNRVFGPGAAAHFVGQTRAKLVTAK
jgi:hypothetical protein